MPHDDGAPHDGANDAADDDPESSDGDDESTDDGGAYGANDDSSRIYDDVSAAHDASSDDSPFDYGYASSGNNVVRYSSLINGVADGDRQLGDHSLGGYHQHETRE